MSGPLINLQKLTAPAAIFISSAWVASSRGVGDGIKFMMFAVAFYIGILIVEQIIFAYNVDQGNYRY
jgi:Na+/H+-dicarboxylate symporter